MRAICVPIRPGLSTMVQVDAHNFKLKELVSAIEKSAIIDALDDANGNQSRAARLLGLNRTTFVMKMRKLGISSANFQGSVA